MPTVVSASQLDFLSLVEYLLCGNLVGVICYVSPATRGYVRSRTMVNGARPRLLTANAAMIPYST